MLLNDNMMEGDAKEGDDENDGIYFSASAKKSKKRVLDDDDEDDVPVTATKKHRLNNADSFLNDEAEYDDDADVDDTNISLSKCGQL